MQAAWYACWAPYWGPRGASIRGLLLIHKKYYYYGILSGVWVHFCVLIHTDYTCDHVIPLGLYGENLTNSYVLEKPSQSSSAGHLSILVSHFRYLTSYGVVGSRLL